MQTVQPANTIAANLRDVDQVMAELMTNSPEINLQLQPMWGLSKKTKMVTIDGFGEENSIQRNNVTASCKIYANGPLILKLRE